MSAECREEGCDALAEADGFCGPCRDEGGYTWLLAFEGGDCEWWDRTGMCGGCGNADCHTGRCPGLFCLICPTRKATGEVPA